MHLPVLLRLQVEGPREARVGSLTLASGARPLQHLQDRPVLGAGLVLADADDPALQQRTSHAHH